MKRNETKNPGCIMFLELWIFSKEMCRETEFPQALIPSSPLVVGAIFRHPHPPAREITGS